MTTNRKGRTGWRQATLETSKHTCHFANFIPCDKGFIVTRVLRGWLLVNLLNWLIHPGELYEE